MARETSTATGGPDYLLVEGMRHYRFGVAFLFAGVVMMIAALFSDYFLGMSSASGAETFVVYLVESAGFALFLAGAVFFVESRAFLRRNKPAT